MFIINYFQPDSCDWIQFAAVCDKIGVLHGLLYACLSNSFLFLPGTLSLSLCTLHKRINHSSSSSSIINQQQQPSSEEECHLRVVSSGRTWRHKTTKLYTQVGRLAGWIGPALPSAITPRVVATMLCCWKGVFPIAENVPILYLGLRYETTPFYSPEGYLIVCLSLSVACYTTQ